MTKRKPPVSPLQLAYGSNESQFGELYLPDETGPYPLVMLIHGGYWRARYGLELMNGLAESLAMRGLAVWNIEYRRVGNSGGGWPGTFEDVANAADCLKKIAQSYELDLNRVVALGHSAGGHLAFWLAARARLPTGSPLAPHKEPLSLRGAISLAGVLDLHLAYRLHLSNDAVIELLGGTPDKFPERYFSASPAALLPLGLPQILIHGTADESVPPEISQQYAEVARRAGDQIRLLEPAEVDHFDIINAGTEVWELTVGEILSLLQ